MGRADTRFVLRFYFISFDWFSGSFCSHGSINVVLKWFVTLMGSKVPGLAAGLEAWRAAISFLKC